MLKEIKWRIRKQSERRLWAVCALRTRTQRNVADSLQHSLIPAFDHLAHTKRKNERILAFSGTVEFGTIFQRAGIVNVKDIAFSGPSFAVFDPLLDANLQFRNLGTAAAAAVFFREDADNNGEQEEQQK